MSAAERQDAEAEAVAAAAPERVVATPAVAPGLGSAQGVLAMQRAAGNAAVARLIDAREAAVRGRVEGATGYDLSGATVHPRSPLADATGAHAVTIGSDVHLA